jgi:hypothetical protein
VAKLLSVPGAVRYDAASRARVMTAKALQKVTRLFTPTTDNRRNQTELPPHQQPATIIKLVQNALSDWGSKEVVVHKKDATVRLAQLTLTAHCWAIAAPATGVIITSDQRAARYAVIDRVARERLEKRGPVKHAPGIGRMANVEAVWPQESTAALCLPRGRERRPPEKYTKHMARLALGSIPPQRRVGSRIPGDGHHNNYR